MSLQTAQPESMLYHHHLHVISSRFCTNTILSDERLKELKTAGHRNKAFIRVNSIVLAFALKISVARSSSTFVAISANVSSPSLVSVILEARPSGELSDTRTDYGLAFDRETKQQTTGHLIIYSSTQILSNMRQLFWSLRRGIWL